MTARVKTLGPPVKGSVTVSEFAGVAQLARALPCQGRGRGFESLHPLHIIAMATWLRQDCQNARPCGRRPVGAERLLRIISSISLVMATWLRQDCQNARPCGRRPVGAERLLRINIGDNLMLKHRTEVVPHSSITFND